MGLNGGWNGPYLSDSQVDYAQHLVRLGAKDEVGYLVARRVPHYDVEWMFAPGELVQKYGRTESSAALELHESTNHDRTIAKTLHANGIDLASVLLMRKSTLGFILPFVKNCLNQPEPEGTWSLSAR
ncbi:hypothetical protein EXIGLDRAFT_751286 [Exidia glandulosa HHB12029]|uniref:Uncharacterized protein n=1 Tax=Exidia glandulosa HHB12029 TaxID=1314781 RepID=A0A165FLT6_EXIGL|nr:hypothetical protein EXIGLDRAFT_751286 [Exidia glandulosa HHB12029]